MNSQKSVIGLDFEFWNGFTPDYVSKEIEEKYFCKNYLQNWDIKQRDMMASLLSHLRLIEHCVEINKNLLIIEDDVSLLNKMNWNDIDFDEFDVYNIGTVGSCYSYFVSVTGAKKLSKYFNKIVISDAFDYELTKLGKEFIIKNVDKEVFTNDTTFTSNIAPKGYIKKIKLL
jgi:GR25 family glycosyltransferase involved in LPS biosynthesis